MIQRELRTLPDYVYPPHPWKLVERTFYPRLLAQTETFFSVSNGYLGMRGGFEEGDPAYENGTFVNGFYESWPIVYGEEAYGFAKTGQTIVNVPDGKIIRLYVDDEPFYLPTANLIRFQRALDMRGGCLEREVLWETPAGKCISIVSRRLVSLRHRHLAAISYEVTVLNADAPVVISSELRYDPAQQAAGNDPRRPRGLNGRALLPGLATAEDRRILLGHRTRSSGMSLVCAMDHLIETECACSHETQCADDEGKLIVSVQAQSGVPIRLIKFMTYHTSRRKGCNELSARAERTLNRALGEGFDSLQQGQREYLDDFWSKADLEIRGNPFVQQATRFNVYQIMQAAARAEGAGIPAKGLTGHGYEGHYFWDTEIYVLPFLIYTSPRIARNLLKFRFGFLDHARKRAREVNQKGALFPWRTINGEEASAYYAAGTAQYHINADIVYALKKYVDLTGDEEFLWQFGAEVLVETARMWVDLGFYSDRRDGRFCIQGVTGPDEYNTVVDNNTFTNLMARENLWYAAATVDSLRKEFPERFRALEDKTSLGADEAGEWKRAADNMYVPYDEKLGVHPQDDTFLDKKPWDTESVPPDKYPLLLHYHPLVIYRHRVIKQADIVLAMFLLGHEFSAEQKRRNFDFYDPLTTGDSSLSVSIQAIVAAELGYFDKAIQYAWYAGLMDLADVSGNVKDGCHVASMGGTWMAAVYGMAGLRDWEGKISFRPRPPRRFEGLRFPLRIRGRLLEVDIARRRVTYTLREGDSLTFRHEDEEIELTHAEPVCERPLEHP